MLSRPDLERIAPTLTDGNVGHAATLYLQDIVLAAMSRETVDQLVFKGGTALMKCYQLDRFSEDLDFTARSRIESDALVSAAVRDLENYGATVAERTTTETERSVSVRLGIQGPLYTGDRRSLSFLRIEINTASTVASVQTRRYTPQFPDLPAFDLVVLPEPEILAEKIRALCTREQPRDLYDIYHLTARSIDVDPELVQEKLAYYDLTYDPDQVLERARRLQANWDSLDALVYWTLPSFEVVYDELERALAPDR